MDKDEQITFWQEVVNQHEMLIDNNNKTNMICEIVLENAKLKLEELKDD